MTPEKSIMTALGLMSGTSLDGVDVALIETDGHAFVKPLAFRCYPYDSAFCAQIRAVLGRPAPDRAASIAAATKAVTDRHADAVERFFQETGVARAAVDLIGFHGQTLWHAPDQKETLQIGDGARLANLTAIPVVYDFRTADVQAGGQGAPLVPLYHRALAATWDKPLALVNIGGVSNVTYIGGDRDDQILAFDMGPGNALLNDWVLERTGQPFDKEGALAATGHVQEQIVAHFLAHPFFAEKPPKSLDRDAFQSFVPSDLSPADGAATLTMMTARAIARGCAFFKDRPVKIWLTGGGRANKTMRRWIAQETGCPVGLVEAQNFNGDALEAEAFAYLAVRSVLKLPLTLPGTTGVPEPLTGGVFAPVTNGRLI